MEKERDSYKIRQLEARETVKKEYEEEDEIHTDKHGRIAGRRARRDND